MKINGSFKRYSSVSLPSLILSFGAATGLWDSASAAEPEQPVTSGNDVTYTIELPQQGAHTYWKHPEYDAVLEVWTDSAKGLRGRLAAINPQDQKVREVVGKILKKEKRDVTDGDVNSFIGMEGALTLEKVGENRWKGSIYWPYKEKSYGVDITQEENILRVRGFLLSLPILGKTVELKPTAPKP